jgi:hypothetical protein
MTLSHGALPGSGFGRQHLDRPGITDDLHFHDRRGTAATRLALAGCSVPQIAAITGHSLGDVEGILETHYLGGTVEVAEAAMMKLDASFGLQPTANRRCEMRLNHCSYKASARGGARCYHPRPAFLECGGPSIEA